MLVMLTTWLPIKRHRKASAIGINSYMTDSAGGWNEIAKDTQPCI